MRRAGGFWPAAVASLAPASALCCLLAAAPVHAYERTINKGGLCTFWGSRGHSFQIDARGTPDVVGTAAFDAVRLSFAQWAGIGCSDLVFPDLGLSMDPADRKVGYFPGELNRNLVLWRTAACAGGAVPAGDPCLTEGGCGNKYDCWDHGSAVIATTTSTSNRFTGQIEDADIELNDAPGPDGNRFIFSTVDSPLCARANQVGCVNIDIRNTVTHEAGHSIGLAHTPIADATMFATAPPGELTKRTVHADDIAAICAIYPKGAPTSTCLTDPISITVAGAGEVKGCGCSATAGAAPALQGLGLAAVAVLLRRRRMNRAPARRTTV